MPHVTFRPATPDDEAFLLEVFTVSHPEYQYLPVPEDQKRHLIAMQHKLQSADYRSRYPDSTHDIIEWDGAGVGRIWVARSAENIDVLDIGLLPSTRDKGIGTRVIDGVKAEAVAAGVPIVSVVQRSNPGSLRWQLRMGFRITGEDEFHIYMKWQPGNGTTPMDGAQPPPASGAASA